MKNSHTKIIALVFAVFIFVPAMVAQDLYTITSLNINTKEYVEESAVFYKDGIVFISNRAQSALQTIIDQNGDPLDDIFFSKQKDNKKWTAPDLFSKELKTRWHEGALCFDKTGKTVYFTRVEDKERTAIYSATLTGSEWTNITLLSFNNQNYSYCHPCLSPDGKKLYFASNRSGNFDIWVCNASRGGWSSPKNLGKAVNSDSAELYPFISESGKLFFTSNRKGGLGGMDIYWTKEFNEQWLPPKALPAPFNSKNNDYALIMDSLERKGFISSDRARSKDLYSYTINIPLFTNPQAIKKNSYKYRFKEDMAEIDSIAFTYEWDFGDGTKLRDKTLDVIHEFKSVGDYTVILNVIDQLTGEVSLNQSTNLVQVRDEIQPVISCPDTIYCNSPVEFNTEKSYLPEFQSPVFYWDFNDGTLESGSKITHEFVFPGNYKILLGAKDKKKDQESSDFISVYKNIVVLTKKN